VTRFEGWEAMGVSRSRDTDLPTARLTGQRARRYAGGSPSQNSDEVDLRFLKLVRDQRIKQFSDLNRSALSLGRYQGDNRTL